jgi:adenine-specific DNA-methyltransferase
MLKRYDHLSKDELARLLEARDRRDATRFGLVWEANEIDRDKAINSDFVELDLIPELSVGQAPWRNLIIEGDNFDALRYLRMAYAGRVKCILIDPPYNTGKKDFVYNDRFVDENDSWRYSTWIEFLYQRLVIARDLLREDGVLLCCINDESRAKLELLLDKVMPGRRIGSFVWRTKDSANDSGGNLSQVHEHVLVYANPQFQFSGKPLSFDDYRNTDDDPEGDWTPQPLTKDAAGF